MEKNPQSGVSKIQNGYIVTTQEDQQTPPTVTYCLTLDEVKVALERYYEPTSIVKPVR